MKDGALYLSTPTLTGSDCVSDMPTTIGFVLTPKRLITLRFAPFAAFDTLMDSTAQRPQPTPRDAFLRARR